MCIRDRRRREQDSSNIKFLGNTKILNQLEKGPSYLRIGLLPVEKAPMRTGSIYILIMKEKQKLELLHLAVLVQP